MSVSLIIALVVALVLFWAVGAYSRLMRLRAAIVRAFAALDNVLAVQPALIQATLPTALAESASTNGAAEARTSWSRLARTGHQYSLALAAARQYPLDAANMVGLSNAQETLRRAWQEQGDSGDGNEALPESVRTRLQRQLELAAGPNQLMAAAVMAYNEAIREFPALLVAVLFRLEPVPHLRLPDLSPSLVPPAGSREEA